MRYWSRMGSRPRAEPNVQCRACGARFHLKSCAINKDKGNCCSVACANKMRAIDQAGAASPKWKGGPENWDRTGSGEWKDCAGCGIHFFAKKRKYRYCTVACHHKHVVHKPTPGHRQVAKTGYIRLTLEDGSRVLEHRWVWEQAHGVKLKSSQHIHHVNGDKTDNRIENLHLFGSAAEHLQHHWQENPEFRPSPKGIPQKRRQKAS